MFKFKKHKPAPVYKITISCSVYPEEHIKNNLINGERRDLSFYIPDEYKWVQIGFSRFEGQARIGKCLWGFYMIDDSTFTVVLQSGQVSKEYAETFSLKVAERISGHLPFKVFRTNEFDDQRLAANGPSELPPEIIDEK